MTHRRLPRWAELRPYLRTQPVQWSLVDRRLAGAATIADLRRIARRHTPRAGVRLRRWRGGDRDEPPPRARCVPPGRVRPERPARRVAGRPVDDDPRSARRAAARVRADRLHPVHEPRGRAGRRPGRRAGRHPVRPVDDGHDLTRRPWPPRPRRPSSWFQLYLWQDRGPGPGPHRPGRGRRLLGADPDRRHAGRGAAPAGRPQRPDDPADADGQDARRHDPPPGLVVQPADDRAAHVRLADRWTGRWPS